jgi:pimeloyl-ACP methyl ester carboxylesterase
MSSENLFVRVSDDAILHSLISRPASPTNNPTLLFLHFYGGSNRTFAALISQLEDDYKIIAPSLRGWGQSTGPTNADGYHITDYATDILHLVLYLKNQKPDMLFNGLIIVGHSMGGKIAQYLVTQPQIQIVLKGLVLLAPASTSPFRFPTEQEREQQVHAYGEEQSAEFVMRNLLLGSSNEVSDGTVAGLVQDAVAGSPGARAAWPAYGMEEDYEQAVNEAVALYETLQGRPLHVVVMEGELDRVETPDGVRERVHDVLGVAGAKVSMELLPGVGHLSPVEAPTSLAQSIRDFNQGFA